MKMAVGLLAHGRGFAGQHRLHDKTLDQADEAGGGSFGVQVRADLSLFDRFGQLAEQQLAVALEHATHLELGRRVGRLLEFVEDEPRHARMRDDELDMRPETSRPVRPGWRTGPQRPEGCSRVSRTQRMAASQMESLVGKCLNTAPCVTPIAAAMSPVVISAGLDSLARRSAASTISDLAFFGGRRVCMLVCAFGKSSDTYHYTPIAAYPTTYREMHVDRRCATLRAPT